MVKLVRYFFDNRKSALTHLTRAEYAASLINLDEKKAESAFAKAWEIRNFEIEMYWKRATYFWAFIASAFAGYFAISCSDNPDVREEFFLICLGLILSIAWLLTNIGSKSWQQNWEAHVDLLEDRFTGPLYKTIFPDATYSVSKINEIVSALFVFVWVLLGVKHLSEKYIDIYTILALGGIFLATIAMLYGHGRGKFSVRSINMKRRTVRYEESL